MSARGRRLAVAFAVASLVTGGALGVGLAQSQGRSPSSRPEPPASTLSAPTSSSGDVPLSQVRLESLAPVRAPFCNRIPANAVTAAVGAGADGSGYASGDRTTLEPGLTDVAHEFGCVFRNGPQTARIWLFAAPVTASASTRLVSEATRRKGCKPTGALKFGNAGAVLACQTADQASLVALGRFADSFVHCELEGPPPGVPDLSVRGQRWCAAAVTALESS